MRLQTAAGESFAGESRVPRLDPFALPVSFAIPLGGGYPGAATATVTLDRQYAVLSRPGRLGAESVPIKSYRGVAVRMVMGAEDGAGSLIVELAHDRALLSIPLLIGDSPEDVAVDWQCWSRSLGLPLLLVEADGSMSQPAAHIGKLLLLKSMPRRRRSVAGSRRPRFLVRRKTGWRRDLGKVEGDELIARD